jgi:hypothetical protein
MTFPTFTTGEVLTAADMNAVGLWLVKKQTIGSAVATVTVSDAFSATYDAYKITITGGAASTNNVLYIQLGSTTTGYYTIMNFASFATFNTPASDGNSNGSSLLYMGSGSADGLSMNAELQNPFLSKRTFAQGNATNGISYAGRSSGILANTTSYTAFSILTNTGTLTGGEIRVYGYRN